MRCWSARCTSVPLLAGADGGSGSRSMYENRNASGQLVNVPIELGDSEIGTGIDGAGATSACMVRGYNRGVTFKVDHL
jgi:hypothetical protein